MLRVYRVNNEEYIVVTPSNTQTGGLAKTVDNMSRLGVTDEEIETGLVSLQLNDHHIAEYGVYKSFMFSRKI